VIQADPLLEAIRRGEPRALARAITRIENRDASAEALLRQLFPYSGRAMLVGLTGAPGSGKSTLADSLAALLRSRGQSVGIVAVDPTSPFSGGAILGDRIRMQRHHADDGVFIRSMATRGALGGLATAAADVALLLDAAGKETVLVETVGVGQDEVDIVRLADVTVVILVPGMGDDVQTIKAGIMEIADVFAINKADRAGADRVEQEVRAMLSIGHRPDGWSVPIVKTVATDGTGVPELLDAATSYIAFLRDRGLLAGKKAVNWRQRLLDLLRERLLARAVNAAGEDHLADLAGRVARREMDPYSAVDAIMQTQP
jgi:LAO/AO transport system kinase